MHLVFSGTRDWFLIHFGSFFRPKINNKSHQNQSKNPLNNRTRKQTYWNTTSFYGISVPLTILCNVAKSSTIELTSIKKQLSNQCCKLDRFLEPTWPYWGRIGGTKLGPIWSQVAPKSNLVIKKMTTCWTPFGSIFVDFGIQVGGILGPSWLQNRKQIDQTTIPKNDWKMSPKKSCGPCK